MKRSIKTLIILTFILLCSCSSTQNVDDVFESKIIIKDIEAWLNLMPGGPGSFHITGKYFLSDEVNEKQVYLDKIIIKESEQTIYNFQAEIQLIDYDKNGIKQFMFLNPSNTIINPMLKDKENIDVTFVFSFNAKMIEKSFQNIPLTKAY